MLHAFHFFNFHVRRGHNANARNLAALLQQFDMRPTNSHAIARAYVDHKTGLLFHYPAA